MLNSSIAFKSKEVWSVVYGSMGSDDDDEWSFGGPEDDLYVWVTDIDWWGLGLDIDIP